MKPIMIRTDTRQAGTCRFCGAPIEWALVPKRGQRMPFNPPLVLLPVQAFGVALPHFAEVDMTQTTSHVATCPKGQSTEETPLRFWIYCHGGAGWHSWRVLSQTNDEPTARWLYQNARDARHEGGVRLIDMETSTVLEEGRCP
jgi:hypothetical protein